MVDLPLNKRQIEFCEHYIATGNATKAAKLAGYSEKTAYSIGSENLKKPEISEYIARRLEEENAGKIAAADEVMRFYTSVMRGEEKDAFGLDASLDTRLTAGREIMKRHNATSEKNKASLEKLDAMLKEFRDAVKSEAD